MRFMQILSNKEVETPSLYLFSFFILKPLFISKLKVEKAIQPMISIDSLVRILFLIIKYPQF